MGLVNARSGCDNSFWVSVDGGGWILWDVARTGGSWKWDDVIQRGGANQMAFNLAAGSHTLRLGVREDGTKIDKLAITNDFSGNPVV